MENPFQIPLKPRLLAAVLERALGLTRLVNGYENRPQNADPEEFLQYTLDALGTTLQVRNQQYLQDIPEKGPILIVANHPLGGLEGVAIARMLIKQRPDLKVLTNHMLRRIPELAEIFIGVDVLSTNAVKDNISGLKQINQHLKSGGALLIFPAGTVATYEFEHRRIQDKPWNRLIGQLVKRNRCDCLPVYVGGRNSRLFYALGMIHKRLRTLLLPRQLSNKLGFQLTLTVGKLIPFNELENLASAQSITEYLRISTDALQTERSAGALASRQKCKSKCAENISVDLLNCAITALQPYRLIEHKDFDVYCAAHEHLGVVMDQIAISREFTFRSVGEGTGKSRDSDEYDAHYLHLFLWDKNASRVAGAYRVGLVDAIIATHGVKGLYTRSLYKYNQSFLDKIGPAIELGRSFVHPDYQRKPSALSLLWRGIGICLLQNPQYHTLFGSVSISREYTDMARALIADTMMTHYKAEDCADKVKPLRPHKVESRVWTEETLSALANIKILSKLIGRCNPGKTLPVLLRHYLSLNGKFICFNVHSGFNDSLEGLILVDVRSTSSRTATRFLGARGYQQFMEYHKMPLAN